MRPSILILTALALLAAIVVGNSAINSLREYNNETPCDQWVKQHPGVYQSPTNPQGCYYLDKSSVDGSIKEFWAGPAKTTARQSHDAMMARAQAELNRFANEHQRCLISGILTNCEYKNLFE